MNNWKEVAEALEGIGFGESDKLPDWRENVNESDEDAPLQGLDLELMNAAVGVDFNSLFHKEEEPDET